MTTKIRKVSLGFTYGMMAWEMAMRLKNVGAQVMWKKDLPKRLVTDASQKTLDRAISYITEIAPDPHPCNAEDFWRSYADIITPQYLDPPK